MVSVLDAIGTNNIDCYNEIEVLQVLLTSTDHMTLCNCLTQSLVNKRKLKRLIMSLWHLNYSL